jgi:hypothetical protein
MALRILQFGNTWCSIYKGMWTPLQMSVADRCIKSSTQPCNLHRQTLAVEWPKGCHLSNKSVHQISALLELSLSTLSAVIVNWKRLGATMAQPRSGRPHKLTEWDRRVLKCVKNVFPWLQHSLPSFKLSLEAMSAQ